ncbi:MAG: LacI family DNA-binding transcriptional regulator [Collinsella sp.]
MDKKNVSMNDVAIAAGVSLKTVSRVINECPDSAREPELLTLIWCFIRPWRRSGFEPTCARVRSLLLTGVHRRFALFHSSAQAVRHDRRQYADAAAEARLLALTMIKKRAGEKMTLAEAARRMPQKAPRRRA